MDTTENALKRRFYELHPLLYGGISIRATDPVFVDPIAFQLHAHGTAASPVNSPRPLGAHTIPDPEETSR